MSVQNGIIPKTVTLAYEPVQGSFALAVGRFSDFNYWTALLLENMVQMNQPPIIINLWFGYETTEVLSSFGAVNNLAHFALAPVSLAQALCSDALRLFLDVVSPCMGQPF